MADYAFVQNAGLELSIGTRILQKRERAHREALSAPGSGGTNWRLALQTTMKQLLQEGAILTHRSERLACLLAGFINIRYIDEPPEREVEGVMRRSGQGGPRGGREMETAPIGERRDG